MENVQKNDNSRLVLALVLIGVGVFWILRKLGIYIEFPHFVVEHIFYPIKQFMHRISHIVFSWPMILIIIGAVLMAAKRSTGLVLVIVGGVFLIPKIFFVTGLTISYLLPVLLIALGVAMIIRKI